MLREDRREDRDDVARVDRHLVAEATTEVRRHDTDHVLRKFGDHGNSSAHDVRRLRRHVDRELSRGAVEIRD